jgi:CBS domain-containing protein
LADADAEVKVRAIDVMTDQVITVRENATVSEVAHLLAKYSISPVPVVDGANRVIGMVSEGDLLHRAETGTERRRTWWLDMLASTDQLARDYIKSHAETVKDVMTRDVISVTDTTAVADIAVLLETRGIKRVPVLRDGKLIGIVSRANLIQALAMTVTGSAVGSANDNDLAIREKLLAELKRKDGPRFRPPTSPSRTALSISGTRMSRTMKGGFADRCPEHSGSARHRGPYAQSRVEAGHRPPRPAEATSRRSTSAHEPNKSRARPTPLAPQHKAKEMRHALVLQPGFIEARSSPPMAAPRSLLVSSAPV